MNPIVKRCATGVPGLDDITGGGLPQSCLYLCEGLPGVGKTTLAIQFLLEGARRGEPCLYVTLSETLLELQAVASSHEWDLSGITVIELASVADAMQATAQNTLFQSAEIELTQLMRLLMDEVTRLKPRRMVLDSLSEFRLLAQNSLRYRREILRLKQRLGAMGCTVLVLDDRQSQGTDAQVHSLVHGGISLDARPLKYGVFRRTLSVMKLRGVRYREGTHDYIIEKGGLRVFPRLIAAEHHTVFDKKEAHSGSAALDQLLGGGLHYGTSNLIVGPAGSGKSTLSGMFAYAACRRGEHVRYYMFDETTATMLTRMADLGMDLRPHIESGRIGLEQVDAASVSPGALSARIRAAVEDGGVRTIVIDSLNGYVTAMPQEEFVYLHLHELVTYLNQQGVLTIMVLAQHGLVGPMGTPIDVSYLADSVTITRYFEALGSIRKAISIIKKRSGQHEGSVRELTMTGNGLVIGEPLKDFQGVLTGVPSYLGPRGGRAAPK